jgi:hypothetical protein
MEQLSENPKSTPKIEEAGVHEISFDHEHVREILARHEREVEAAKQERRAGRPEGKLSAGLQDRLRSCNIAQLETVKRMSKRLIARQRKPPLDRDCPTRFAVNVVASFGYKNRLFRAELKRTTKRAEKVYVNGPYVYAYRWDGAYVRPEYFGSKGLSKKLPRKVWLALKGQLTGPEVEKLKSELSESWSHASEGESTEA